MPGFCAKGELVWKARQCNSIHGGNVYIDNRLLEENCVIGATEGEMSVTVPKGCLFLMGDNREHSSDSRIWKEAFIKLEKVYAKYEKPWSP